MLMLPTVLLKHQHRQDQHYDWLLGDPANPGGLLWTARVAVASNHWRALPCFDITPIKLHRRNYLTYEGPVSGGRGTVRRVDQGHHTPLMWTQSRIIVDVSMRHFSGRLELQRISPKLWRVRPLAVAQTSGAAAR